MLTEITENSNNTFRLNCTSSGWGVGFDFPTRRSAESVAQAIERASAPTEKFVVVIYDKGEALIEATDIIDAAEHALELADDDPERVLEVRRADYRDVGRGA